MRQFVFLFFFLIFASPSYAQQIPDLDAIPSVAGGDLFYCVDVSDTTDRAEGTGKKCTATQIGTAVDTNTNASTICAGSTTYLDGEGNCDDISGVYVQAADWTTIDNYPSACTGSNFVQGLGDTLTCAQPSDVTGNAATATALAANGGNCTAGSYPLGIDASGAVESCTDATTEIDSAISTHAAIADSHQDLVTLAGTPDYITISGQVITRAKLDINDDTNLVAGAGLTLSTNTIDVASTETSFLTDAAADACGAGTKGRVGITNAGSVVWFCDDQATPVTTYLALGASDGDALAGDSATAFFDAGTIEHERGGLEADVSAYNGLIRIASGSTTNVTDLAGLETAIGATNIIIAADIDTANEFAAIMTEVSGTGDFVRATSPTLVTPALGTPSVLVLTNATLLPLTALVDDTTTAVGVGTIELGHATDTTVGRTAAGRINVEGKDVCLDDGTDCRTASDSQTGIVELATIAETDTGTDTGRAVTPDGLQGSKRNIRYLIFSLVDSATDVAVDTSIGGDFTIPISGTILQDDTLHDQLAATTDTAGTTGTMVVDIHLNGTTIMTTNKLDIETTEKGTQTATTQPDLTTTTISAGDILTFDIDAIHTTAAKGLKILMAIRED